jgi:ribosome-binding factor A
MNRRTERIGRLMQKQIGRILIAELSDPRIDPARTSVTRVRVQEDLLQAKVYISILGTDAEQRRGLAALQHAAGRVQGLLKRRISLRRLPRLVFLADEQFKGALRTWQIIRQAMDEIRAREAKMAGADQTEPEDIVEPQPGDLESQQAASFPPEVEDEE